MPFQTCGSESVCRRVMGNGADSLDVALRAGARCMYLIVYHADPPRIEAACIVDACLMGTPAPESVRHCRSLDLVVQTHAARFAEVFCGGEMPAYDREPWEAVTKFNLYDAVALVTRAPQTRTTSAHH